MNLSELKTLLKERSDVSFKLPNGKKVPAHFHVTELGKISKHFMDCGGKERMESRASIQLWSSVDFHHRLSPQKLIRIIEMSEQKLGLTDEEIEVEYQGDTIGKYGLAAGDETFQLTSTKTACLAQEDCAVPAFVTNIAEKAAGCCTPESGCC